MWLSKIVGRSIPFRHFGLLLQKEYATSLIRTAALFSERASDTSPKVDKSDASFRESASTRATARGKQHTHFSTSARSPSTTFHAPRFYGYASPHHRTMHTYAVGRLRHRPDETSSSDLLRNLPRNRETTLFLLLPTARKRHPPSCASTSPKDASIPILQHSSIRLY